MQEFTWSMMDRKVNFMISVSSHLYVNFTGGLPSFHQYLKHLKSTKPEVDVINRFAEGYHDRLQMPLQPLMDNLESATYEVFEMDPIKYQEYERAITQAVMDRQDYKCMYVSFEFLNRVS
jgi:protein arginine N-methyltransferase 5